MEVKARSKSLPDLKAYLEQERARLLAQIAASEITTGEEHSGYSTHMADDATTVYEQARNVGQLRDHERRLAEVEDALARIAAGAYGKCRHCGEAIDTARLRAMPTATLCLDCQSAADQRTQ